MTRDTILDRLANRARSQGPQSALYYRNEERWDSLSWSGYYQRVRDFAGGLIAHGYAPGDAVAIIGNNCPEWPIADLGAMAARAVPAGIYQTSTAEQAAYVAGHCDAAVIVVENKALWSKINAQRASLPKLKKIVMIREADAVSDPTVMSFAQFCDSGRTHTAAVDERFAAIQDDDLATLIYTSGTTGPPKGAMLSNRNLSFAALAALAANGAQSGDSVVSYLPMSHIAEQMMTLHVAITSGYSVWFADSLDKLRETLLQARPTLMLGVPRVWEKLKVALETKFAEQKGPRELLIRWARGVGVQAGYHNIERGGPSGALAAQEWLARRLFFSKVAAQIGLDRVRIAVTGAAPISRDVLEFFMSIGLVIHEVYGQTENCGLATYCRPQPGMTRLGTVGKAMPGVEVKLAPDGEILVKSDAVFIGYYKDEAATRACVIDGYLHSGDVGEFDGDRFLRITDRKKDLIITSGGKNVAPQNLERLLCGIDGISQAVVIGDRRKFLVAILTMDPDKSRVLARTHGWPDERERLAKHSEFLAHVQRGIDRINAQLARYESIKKFVLLAQDFSVDTGELTPTQKVKRKVVHEKFGREIEGMYADSADG